MNFLKRLWNNIVTSNDEPYINKISELKKNFNIIRGSLNNCAIELTNKDLKLTEVEAQYDNLLEEHDLITKELESYKLPIEEQELKSYWDTKYNQGVISYGGRSLPFSKEHITVPVNVLVTPKDNFIIQDLIKWGLYKTNEDPETLLPKIYKKIHDTYYHYSYDKNVWGISEVWEFPFEMRAKAKKTKWAFDCDSWAIFQLSYYIAAGINNWRIRVVCGDAFLGGHATIYAYSMIDNDWHHLNSTYGNGYQSKNKVNEFPTHKDARDKVTLVGNDMIGIYNVWFSFNDELCWYDMKTDIPKELQLTKKF